MADVGNTPETAGQTEVGDTVDGLIEADDDYDWYRVALTADARYVLTLEGGTLDDPLLLVMDQAGRQLATNDDRAPGNLNSRLTFTAPYTGDYHLVATGAYAVGTGSYRLSVKPATAGATDSEEPGAARPVEDATDRLRAARLADPKIAALFPDPAFRWVGRDGDGDGIPDITYAFHTTAPDYFHRDPNYDGARFETMTASQRTACRSVLARWAEVANVEFRPLTAAERTAGEAPMLAFGALDRPSPIYGWASLPFDSEQAGHFWLNNRVEANSDLTPGADGFHTILHEIGHALGLTHPFDAVSTLPLAAGSEENFRYTVMSYTGHPNYPATWPGGPMLWDVAAIQAMYGANRRTRTGDDMYRWSRDETLLATLWDAGGNDAISAANQERACRIDLRAGRYSSIGSIDGQGDARDNVAIAYGVRIETAVGGSADDVLIGNSLDNRLRGGGGDDSLNGGGGTDTALFSGSRGRYRFTAAAAGVVEATGPDGTDRLTGIERVRFGTSRAVAMADLLTDAVQAKPLVAPAAGSAMAGGRGAGGTGELSATRGLLAHAG